MQFVVMSFFKSMQANRRKSWLLNDLEILDKRIFFMKIVHVLFEKSVIWLY